LTHPHTGEGIDPRKVAGVLALTMVALYVAFG